MEVIQIERGPIIGPVNSARRSAGTAKFTGREMAERAAKERQCVGYHRSKERKESATRATDEGG